MHKANGMPLVDFSKVLAIVLPNITPRDAQVYLPRVNEVQQAGYKDTQCTPSI